MTKVVKEKRKKREVIYQGKIVDLFVDQVTIPDGSTHIREVVGHQPAVAIVPVLDDGQLLLIRQYRYVVDQVCWEIPAGLMDKGETAHQAAKRECLEETGYQAGNLKSLGWLYSSPGFTQEKIYLFLATRLKHSGSLNLDKDEFLTVKKVNIDRLLSMIDKKQINDGKTITALLLAAKHLNILI